MCLCLTGYGLASNFQFERMVGFGSSGVGRGAIERVHGPAVEALAVGVGGDQRADFAKEAAAVASSSCEQACGRAQHTSALEWELSTRPRLEKLDVELAAYTLLVAGEQAIKLVLANPYTFTAERYQRFARSILATL